MAPKGFIDRQIADYSVTVMQESTVSQCFHVRPEVAVMNGQQCEQGNKKYSRSVLNSACIERHSIQLPFLNSTAKAYKHQALIQGVNNHFRGSSISPRVN